MVKTDVTTPWISYNLFDNLEILYALFKSMVEGCSKQQWDEDVGPIGEEKIGANC